MAKPFTLNLGSKKNGIYLSQQQVDLLTIVNLKSKDEIGEYISKTCSQFPSKNADELIDFEGSSLEECKRQLFDSYRDTLVTYLENSKMTRADKAKAKLAKTGLTEEQISEVMEVLEHGEKGTYTFLEQKYGEDFVKRFNHFMVDDFENIKDESVTYDVIEALDRQIKEDDSIDTIVIATGKYDNSVLQNGHGFEFDPYFTTKGLEYCKIAGKHMRYHALFDYAHLKKLLESGKGVEDHDEILAEMKRFVKDSVDYINANNEQMQDGSMRIDTVEVFNELVEYNKLENEREQYDMAWEKYFGITTKEIMSCFDDIKKPNGVSYMYNETMLEECGVRREKVEEVFDEIQSISPDFLDKFGDQMHLEHLHTVPCTDTTPYGKKQELEESFDLVKRIENKGVSVECSEFDIHLETDTAEKVADLIKQGKMTEEQVAVLKKEWINIISELANEKGVNFDRTSYWSILDGVDHNLVRANIKRQEEGKEPLKTVYAGLYGNGENLGRLDDIEHERSDLLKSVVEATEETTRNGKIEEQRENIIGMENQEKNMSEIDYGSDRIRK